MEFAYQASLKSHQQGEEQVPVLFVLKVWHDEHRCRAYLHDENSSAHPEEKEILIGGIGWKVSNIGKETHPTRGGQMEVTVVELN